MTNITPFRPRAVAIPGDLSVVCQQYLDHLSARAYSIETVKAYRTDLEQFVGYLQSLDCSLIQTVSTAMVDGFIDAMISGNGVKPRTAARKLEAVRGLFRFAISRNLINPNMDPCERATSPRVHYAPPVAPDKESLVAMINSIPWDATGIRDRLICLLMFGSALRIGGVISLDVFNPEQPPMTGVRPSGVILYRNKGGDIGETVALTETMDVLEQWLAVRHRFTRNDDCPALILTSRGTRPSRVSVHGWVTARAKAFGIKIHSHLFRHARAQDAIENGNLDDAQYLLGHKHRSTTADMYGFKSKERVRREVLEKLPINGIHGRASC